MFEDLIKNNILGSSSQCYNLMHSITRAFQVKKMVEIGTFKGISTIHFCQAILDNKNLPEIYTIDKWDNYGIDYQYIKPEAEELFKSLDFAKYITMITGDSKEILQPLFEKINFVDMCFIDGDHLPENVINDFNICSQFTNTILLHDTQDGSLEYINNIRNNGWNTLSFPTRYLEGDGHLVGITLAVKNEKI